MTHERLRELMTYDPETGHLTWLQRRGRMVKPGDRAGSAHVSGYIYIILDGRSYKAHRLAWFYVYGEWPEQIDHINCVRDDNRLVNLRSANQCQNLQNVKRFVTNKSGFKGVGLHNGKWRARITVEHKPIWLGHFPSAEDAYAAYCTAARQLHGEFARLE